MPPAEQGHGPARRGRRDPRLAAEIALDAQAGLPDETESEPEQLLFDGDVVGCKITHEIAHSTGRSATTSFVTYSATTRVQPEETDNDAYVRVGNAVLGAVGELMVHAEAQYRDFETERANRRISPQ